MTHFRLFGICFFWRRGLGLSLSVYRSRREQTLRDDRGTRFGVAPAKGRLQRHSRGAISAEWSFQKSISFRRNFRKIPIPPTPNFASRSRSAANRAGVYALTRFADIEVLLDRFDGGRACRESFSFQRVACARRRVRGNVGLLPNFLNEVIQWPTPRSSSDP